MQRNRDDQSTRTSADPARTPATPVAVVIVEPLGIVRTSLEMILSEVEDLEVFATAGETDEALDRVGELHRTGGGVVIVALEIAGERDSLWLIRTIRDRSPELIVLATGTDLDPDAISQGLFVGADGFIHKNSTPERFIEATRRAANGELVLEGLPRGALGGIVDAMEQQRSSQPALTEREVSVLTAAADGLTAREIGRRLGVSERTVTTHLHHIYRKLGASGRVAALSAAMRLGVLLPPSERDGRHVVAV
jgi:DNA-binding NarL/FixJ family response regulator